MVSHPDFSWAEVGARIRDWRHRQGMSQQALAEAASLTQNGVFRLESGQTNPQLLTLQRIASALGCSVRDLVVGSSDIDPSLAERFRRIKRIVESKDRAAIQMLDNGIETAEAFLEHVIRRLRQPPLGRIVAGEGRRSPADDLFWMKGPDQRRSEADGKAIVQTVRKAGKPFRNSGARHETKNKTES